MKMLFIVFFVPKDLGCRYLSAYLEKMGHDTRILALKTQQAGTLKARPAEHEIEEKCFRVVGGNASVNAFQQQDISEEELKHLTEFIRGWQPDIVGFGTRSKNFKYLPRIIPAIREGKPDALLLAGGFGPSLEPEIPLEMGVDVVIRGEGEYILAEMLKRIENGENWQDIPGVAYMKNGEPVINKITSIEKNLDNYPFPIVDSSKIFLIDKNQLHSAQNAAFGNTYGQTTHFILSTRGCPAECSYCGGRTLRDKFKKEGVLIPRIRRRSLQNVLQELKVVKKNPEILQIIFSDEYFIHPVEETINFFRDYAKEIQLPFHALLSPDQVANHPELLDAAVNAGLMFGTFGLQTGNAGFCKTMYNRKNNNANILQSIHMTTKRRVNGWLYMILGNPLEERRYFDDTLDFISQMPTFDPSFRTRYYFESNKLAIPYGSPPIIRQHPELHTLKTSCGDFYHDAMMLEFRLLFGDADFTALRNDRLYKKHPHELGALYHDTLKKLHEEYLFRELARLNGRKVNIFGGGAAYERYKDLFKEIKISNFIIDPIYNPPALKDGAPVVAPGEPINQELPMLIMAGMDNINPLWRRANKIYPAARDIVGCAYVN